MAQQKQEQDLNQLLKVRRDKLADLQANGKDPFQITKFNQTHHSMEVKNLYEAHEAELLKDRAEVDVTGLDEEQAKEAVKKDYEERREIMDASPIHVSIAGRMMFKRVMGKASFCNIQDLQGNIQVYVARDAIGADSYADFKKSDIGDIFGLEGFAFRTRTGEISIHAEKMTLLSKSLQILPEKFHGLTDTDTRYRQRYVDLIMNQDSKNVFIKRSQILKEIRNFLADRDFMEVETPMLVANAGGAAARPFETHYNALNEDVKLRISLELYLKRLIVGGLERVYEIGRVFRNEGVDTRHNPEFTLMELYQAYTDYEGMMELTESMFRYLAEKVCGSAKISYNGIEIDLSKPFERLTMNDAIKKYAGIDFDEVADDEAAKKLADEHHIEYEERHKKGDIINLFFEEYCEKELIQPTFIMDHPIEISPLTKKKPSDPNKVERFELFINTWEMCNAYSELNDPIDQRERFKAQDALADAGDEEANHTDEDFLNALEIGMPPTGGIGYGIDRLVMLLTDSQAIRDVLLFPTMKSLDKPEDGAQKAKKEEAHETLKSSISREDALALLKKYNSESFHIQHALTVEGVMRWFAKELGHADEEEFWGITGLLHDIDFEQFPEEHCVKAPELLREGGVSEEMIHAICSHGFGICCDVEPTLEMEKVLFAADELTGLIWSCALMRPSKSTKDMEVKSLKKKFKDKRFAAGCSREVITQGAERLGWELDELFAKTIEAMRSCEDSVAAAMEN